MAIFIDDDTRLVVQGITGRDGSFHTQQMMEYGTRVVAGVTPPTTSVPYSIICCVWKEPSRPVIPCTRRRVSRSMKMAILRLPALRDLHGLLHHV
ncbi:MAG TPA: hypothetical protein VMK65_02760, partial [Longimicrobiales bacterium]|nr:hypothetical protein [Longimicrobiales bacterium]